MSDSERSTFDRLGEFVAQAMKKTGTPGVSVGVLFEGEMYTAGFGVTNVDHPLSVTDETLFQIGSITKTFTGTAIMRLAERGKVDLDATVRTYVPDFELADQETAAKVTVRHLLTHTGGWQGDFFYLPGEGDDCLSKYVAGMAELEQLAPLGTVWSYNNSALILAGHILEMVTGKSVQEVLKELVLEPLGMQNAFVKASDVITHRFAVGHNVTEEGAQVARPYAIPRVGHSSGAITCHVKDLLRYARFHVGNGVAEDGTRLLTPESLSLMQSPQVIRWGDIEAMGLTWFISEVNGMRCVFHEGGTNGQIAKLTLVPECNFAIAVLTNADRGGSIARDVDRWAFKHYLGLEMMDPSPIDTPEEKLIPYVGCYKGYMHDVELGILGGRLVAQITYKWGMLGPPPVLPPMSLALIGEDQFLVMDGPRKDSQGQIVRKPDGAVGWLRLVYRIHERATR